MIGHPLGHALGHPLGVLLGQGSLARGGAPVSLLPAGTPVVSAAATTLSLSKGALGFAVGDLALIVQLGTSAPTTPSGYTAIASSVSGSFTQRLDVFAKTIATTGEATTSVGITQATSGVLQGLFLGLRAKTTPVLADSANASVFQTGSATEPMVGLTPTAKGMALTIMACNKASGAGVIFTPSAGWVQEYPGAIFNFRLGVAARAVASLAALAGTMTLNQAITTPSWNKLTLNFKPS